MLALYIYPISLAIISLGVAALEAVFPHRKDQRQLRKRLGSDLMHLVFNGHFLGLILFGIATNFALPYIDQALTSVGLLESVYRNAAQPWPMALQIIVALVVVDFVQWCVHNLLHRVSWLWEFHKTHHSVKDGEMDWIVAFRFQWTEVVVYKSILYLPLAFFGFSQEAVLFHAIFGTVIGHLNHANLDWDWGPLKYVFNSPNMHIWHHDYDGDEETTVNFGIIFSTWDWLFGTAKMPDHPPERIGFEGVEAFPDTFLTQSVWPLQRLIPALRKQQALASVVGVVLLSTGWWLHLPSANLTATPMFGEPAAASQPASDVTAAAYGADEGARAEALARFGADAKADGFAHPEAMVSVRELAAALGHPRLVLLDVRPEARFEEGHIPTARQLYRGAYSNSDPIPGVSRGAEELDALLARLGVRADSVVVAYTDGGPEAYRLWWTLRQVTGVPIRVLDGGLQRWKHEGHGLAMGDGLPLPAPPTTAAPLAPRPKAAHEPGWARVERFLKAHPDARLIDTRSADEYAGREQHRKAARAGHIPNAKHLNWYAIVRSTEDDHRLASPDALRAGPLGALKLTDGAPVVTYCQSGTRSSATYFALYQLGHDEARMINYDGSWAEYSRTQHPVAQAPAAP